MKALRIPALLLGVAAAAFYVPASAQQLNAHFSCGETHEDVGLKSFLTDTGTIKLNGNTIEEFYWESSVFHSSHGLECSIDQADGLQAEFIGEEQRQAWRVMLQDPAAARARRGYGISERLNCTVRIERTGDVVHVAPSCPALCGSRRNFTEFSFDVKSGKCRYDD